CTPHLYTPFPYSTLFRSSNETGYFPYTPATNLLYGLHEAIAMLLEEGLDTVFERHKRHGEATRRAVRAWGLEVLCTEASEYSPRSEEHTSNSSHVSLSYA